MVAPLTPTQRRVLDFLREFVERHRFAPTAREVAGRFGIAVKNGFYYLEVLERKGYIRRKRHHPRRIEFVGEGLSRPAVRIPVLGRVPAGGPREAVEEVEGEMLLDPGLAGDGEIVVAVIDGDATVKRLRRWKGKIRLEAANPAYPPIVVPAGAASFRIAGKVVGVYRKL